MSVEEQMELILKEGIKKHYQTIEQMSSLERRILMDMIDDRITQNDKRTTILLYGVVVIAVIILLASMYCLI